MKKFKILITLIIIILLLLNLKNNTIEKSDKINITTSFYPIYLLTQEITKNSPKINLNNMASSSIGCLHDYQLNTKDIKTLYNTDLFIINGGNMESFIDEITQSMPLLEIVDTSINTNMIENIEHNIHTHNENDEHNHENINSHIWLSLDNAIIQAENIYKAISKKDYENEIIYKKNLENFYKEINKLKNNIKNLNFSEKNVAVFHEGYSYLSEQFGFNIKAEMYIDENIDPSPKSMANTIDNIKKNNINVIFCADDSSLKIAKTISNETNKKIYILNPLTYDENQNKTYIDLMYENFNIIKEALK